MTASDLIERHVEALLARIREDDQLDDSIFEGEVKGKPERYVNVWHDTGFFEPRSILGEHQDVEITFTIHSVGNDRWQATWVDGRVLAALNDVVLTVPGRRCWKLQPSGSQPVQKDDDVLPVKFFAVRRFVLHSTPERQSP